ncbi:MAG: sulfite exporter TauE/SafE family protein [Gammaproteobacteria bacterium]|nr:sulfite exporter TauE/SafE family protein [Gammaproteobacteria bacterium]
MIWGLLLLAGLLAGTVAGLLGVGGGLITVPIMVWLLPQLGVPAEQVMHVAVATALAIIIPTAIVSARSHHQRGAVDWSLFARFTPGLLLGGLLAAAIASLLPRFWMQFLFGTFLLLVALSMLLGEPRLAGRALISRLEQFIVATLIASWAALVGTGGGTLTVPYLYWRGVALRTAVGTSAACGLPIALAGMLGFVWIGLGETADEAFFGYVQWQVAGLMMLGSVLAAPWGAKLAHQLPVPVLKKILGGVMLLVAGRLLWGLQTL